MNAKRKSRIYSVRLKQSQKGMGLIELMMAVLIFAVCIAGLTTMQLKSGMSSLDSHQRSVALWRARGLVDRITVNNSEEALKAYQTGLRDLTSCPKTAPRLCEATTSNRNPAACSVVALANNDIWDVFCDDDDGLDNQLIDFNASLTCAGTCAPNVNMVLQVSWISKVADSDTRLSTKKTAVGSMSIAANQDFIALDFQP